MVLTAMGFFSSGLQLAAANRIRESISNDTGLIVITGEAGTGKTFLLHRIIDTLPGRILPIFFHAPPTNLDDFVGYILEKLEVRGIEPRGQQGCEENIGVLQDYLRQRQRQGQASVVFVDDAQNLSSSLLSCIVRLQAGQQVAKRVVQLTLIGLPRLLAMLQQPSLQSSLPPSHVRIEIPPLSAAEAAAFLGSRHAHRPPLSPEAIRGILHHAHGIPRLIKMLCQCASFAAKASDAETITGEMVDEAVQTCELAVQSHCVSSTFDASGDRSRDDTDILSPASFSHNHPSPEGFAYSFKHEERPMYRTENINKVLKTLQSGSPDVEAAALISEDGLMIASVLPQDLDETRVAGMSATLLSLGTRAAVELGRGDVQEVVVRGRQGYSVMVNVGRGALLLVVANENAKLGLIFFDMREAANALRQIL